MYLTAETLFNFLSAKDDELDTLILCRSSEVNLMTTDQSLYEALGSFEDRTQIDYNRLVKLLEVTAIAPFTEMMKTTRKVLTDKRVQEIRKNIKINES